MSEDTGEETRIAHPGARCRVVGEHAVSKNGTALVCRINPEKPPADGHARWGAANPAPPPRRRRGGHRTRQGLERRYVNQWAAEQPPADAPLPDTLLEQLNDRQVAALRTAAGLMHGGPSPRRSDLDKLDVAGLLQDGKLTSRGADALRRLGPVPEFTAMVNAPAPVNRTPHTAGATANGPVEPDDSTTPVSGWEEYDQCPVCPAKPGRPCRDLRRARAGHVGRTTPTTDHPHRGRPKLTTPLPRPVAPTEPARQPAPQRVAACGNCYLHLDGVAARESTAIPGICQDCAKQMGRPEPAAVVQAPVQLHVTTIEGPDSVGHFGWSCICGEDVSGLEALDVVEHAMDHGPLAADSPLPHACTGCGDLLPDGNNTGVCTDCTADDIPMETPEDAAARAAYEKARKHGIPELTDEEVDAARRFTGGDPQYISTLDYSHEQRRMQRNNAAREERIAAARRFRLEGSDDALAAAFATSERGDDAHEELRRQVYLRGITDIRLADEASAPTLNDFDRQQYQDEVTRREGLRAAAQAAMDWTPFGACPTCLVPPAGPCRDLRSPGGYNHTPHDGRPAVAAQPPVDEAELAAQAGYARFIADPDNTTDDELVAALGASNLDFADRANIERHIARRARARTARPTEIRTDLAPMARALKEEQRMPQIPEHVARDIAQTAGADEARAEVLRQQYRARRRAADVGLSNLTDDELSGMADDPKARQDLRSAARMELGVRRNQKAAGDLPTYDGPPVDGRHSTTPLSENGWGFDPVRPVSYHPDGPTGFAVEGMGNDRLIDVDGEPLGEVLGKVATDVVQRRRTPAEGLAAVQAIRDRLPAGGKARSRLDWAIQDMEAPETPLPDLPAGTPEPLRRLVADLHAVPLCRRDTTLELEPVIQMARKVAAGQASGSMVVRELQTFANRRHESLGDVGKFTIDEAIQRAAAELDAHFVMDRQARAAQAK